MIIKTRIIDILKNDWNESSQSFKQINFNKLRNIFIPEIFKIYNDKNTDIISCYQNEKYVII